MREHRTYSLKLDGSNDEDGWIAQLWTRTPAGGYRVVARGLAPSAMAAVLSAVEALGEAEVQAGALP